MERVNKKTAIFALVTVLALGLVGAATYAVIAYLSKDDGPAASSETVELNVVQGKDITTTQSVDLPAELPPETPIYEDAELLYVSTTSVSGDAKEYSLSYRAETSAGELFDFYKSALNKNGWRTNFSRSEAASTAIAATHPEKGLVADFSSHSINEGRETLYQLSVSPTNIAALQTP